MTMRRSRAKMTKKDKIGDDDDGIANDLDHIISNHQGVNVKARNFLCHVLRDLAKAGTK